jgi:hypothetical protein
MLSKPPEPATKDFVAGGVREGVEQFGALVKKVDFPKFVGGLIKNVFQAIVESSIEQMRLWGVDRKRREDCRAVHAGQHQPGHRSRLPGHRYPDTLGISLTTGSDAFAEGEGAATTEARLEARGDEPEARLAEISRELKVDPPVTDLSDADAERRLVVAARLEMARSRQQLLASMVMLGINRIVVTDGSIRAKVIFDMRAADRVQRSYTAQMHDTEAQRYKESMQTGFGAWYSPASASLSLEGQQEHVATVGSAVDESSESRAEVKANLSGEVRVNFNSDYLPLEKMATPEMMATIQGNSTPYNPNANPAEGAAR